MQNLNTMRFVGMPHVQTRAGSRWFQDELRTIVDPSFISSALHQLSATIQLHPDSQIRHDAASSMGLSRESSSHFEQDMMDRLAHAHLQMAIGTMFSLLDAYNIGASKSFPFLTHFGVADF